MPSPDARHHLRAFVDAFVPPHRQGDWWRALGRIGGGDRSLVVRHGVDGFDVDEQPETVAWTGSREPRATLRARLLAAAPLPVGPTTPVVVLDLLPLDPEVTTTTLHAALDDLTDGRLAYDAVISVLAGRLALVLDHHDGLRWCARPRSPARP